MAARRPDSRNGALYALPAAAFSQRAGRNHLSCHRSETSDAASHGRLTEQQRSAAGIRQNLIRVAVGLEHLDDLKADLSRGLDTLS